LYKAQVQVDQGSPHKTRDTENYRGESGGKSLEHMGTGDIFWNRTPMALYYKIRIDKRDLIKLHSFCKAKDAVDKTKRQPIDWENIFTNSTSNRGLLSNIYKELKKLDSRGGKNPF
jgi:hypothetical protein